MKVVADLPQAGKMVADASTEVVIHTTNGAQITWPFNSLVLHNVVVITLPANAQYSISSGEIGSLLRDVHRLSVNQSQQTANWDELMSLKAQSNVLAVFFRDNYAEEIAAGEHARYNTAVDVVLHYLTVERAVAKWGFWERLRFAFFGHGHGH